MDGVNLNTRPFVSLGDLDLSVDWGVIVRLSDGEPYRILLENLCRDKWGMSCSSETADLAVGTVKKFFWPAGFHISGLIATVHTAPTGDDINLNVTMDGVPLTSNPITIINGETIYVVPPAGPGSFDVDLIDPVQGTYSEVIIAQVGSTTPGMALTLWFEGYWKE